LRYILYLLLFATAAFSENLVLEAEAEDTVSNVVLDHYLSSLQEQHVSPREVSMEVEIKAELPSIGKSGTLRALRSISRLGQITYKALTFQGDSTIKKDVIARYMTAEIEAATKGDIGITRENYKFKYYGVYGNGDWRLHLYEMSPRQKRLGLFQGWVWLEAKTGLPVREQGELVKNPSVFLKKVTFLRDYEIKDGLAFPVKIESSVDTRLVGRAEVVIHYANYSKAQDDLTKVVAWLAAGHR